MKALIGYNIPFSGLKLGTHHFTFDITEDFFQHFEGSLLNKSKLKVELGFDKRSTMFVLDFVFNGTIQTVCDRCLDEVDLAISGKHQFIIKIQDDPGEDIEVIYIKSTESNLDVSAFVYEALHLNIPLKKACELSEEDLPSCGFNTDDYYEDSETDEVEDEIIESDIWSALKDIKIDK
jgi:uncharacterized protein